MATELPDWAPVELRDYYKQWTQNSPELQNSAFHCLEALITDERMKLIWKKLEPLAREKNKKEYGFDIFLLAEETGGPYGHETMTPAELARTVSKIEKLSHELAGLVRQIMPWQSWQFVEGSSQHTRKMFIANVIEKVGTQAEQVLSQPRALSNPNVKHASRNYFVRRLSAYFRDTFDAPMHDIVAEMHSIFFPDSRFIDSNNVQSIIRNSRL